MWGGDWHWRSVDVAVKGGTMTGGPRGVFTLMGLALLATLLSLAETWHHSSVTTVTETGNPKLLATLEVVVVFPHTAPKQTGSLQVLRRRTGRP